MEGRNWLVRRAERRLGPKLGNLVHIASTRRIRWGWLLPCLAIGFAYGVVGEFIGGPRSTSTPNEFQNIPLFIITSGLTGLILWAITFTVAFRKLLVFEGGIVASYASAASTQVFPWGMIDAESICAVTTQDGSSPSSLLEAKTLTKLGLRGRWAVVFYGSHETNPKTGSAPAIGFWTFESSSNPAALVHAISSAMSDAGVSAAAHIEARALPPRVLTTHTVLD